MKTTSPHILQYGYSQGLLSGLYSEVGGHIVKQFLLEKYIYNESNAERSEAEKCLGLNKEFYINIHYMFVDI